MADSAALVLAFVNTRADGAGHRERFGGAAGFADWAVEHGLLDAGESVAESDAAAARELRDALVVVMLDHAEDPLVGEDMVAAAEATLAAAGARHLLRTVLAADGATLVAASSGTPGVLGAVLAAATEVARAPEWGRMKACCFTPCRHGFIDTTRNAARRYCTPACGSKATMRAYRERQRDAGKRAQSVPDEEQHRASER